MKFHNQRSFMGHEISNVNNKPLLRKKGKQWIVVAVSALILAGFGGMVSTTTHADTTAQPATTKVAPKPANNSDNSSNIMQQAQGMHKALTNNAAVQKPSAPSSTAAKKTAPASATSTSAKSNSVSVSSSASSQALSSVNSASAKSSSVSSNSNSSNNKATKPAVHMMLMSSPTPSVQSGTWGTAHWTLNNGNLTLTNGTIQDGKLPTGLRTSDITSITTYKSSPVTYYLEGSMGQFANANENNNVNTDTSGTGYGTSAHFSNLQSIDFSGMNFEHDPSVQSDQLFNPLTNGGGGGADYPSMKAMFAGDTKLSTVKGLHVSPATHLVDMSGMFADCPALSDLDLSQVYTPKLAFIGNIFHGDTGLRSVNMSNINTIDITKKNASNSSWGFENMFTGTHIQSLKLGPNTKLSGNTGITTNGDWIQINRNTNNASVLTNSDVKKGLTFGIWQPTIASGKWNTTSWGLDSDGDLVLQDGQITNSKSDANIITFNKDNKPIVTGKLDWSKVQNIYTNGNPAHNVTAPSDMGGLFSGLNNLHYVYLNGMNTQNTTNMNSVFANDSNLKDVEFGPNFNTSNVTDFNYMFIADTNLIKLDLSDFDTRKAANNTSTPGLNAGVGIGSMLSNNDGGPKSSENTVPQQTLILGLYTILGVKNGTNGANLPDGVSFVNTTTKQILTNSDANEPHLTDGQPHAGTWTRNAEILNYIDQNTSHRVGQTVITKPLNTPITVSNTPNGYHVSNPNQSFVVNGGITDVAVKPNSETERIDYIYHKNSTQSYSEGSTTMTGSYGFSSNASGSTGLSAGYKLSSANNPFTYSSNNATLDVSVVPSTVTDTIKYQYNGQTLASQSFTGNDYRASQAGSNSVDITSSNDSDVPANYHLSNNDNSFSYDGNAHNVAIEPNTATDTIYYKYNKSSVGSSKFIGNSVAASGASDTSFKVTKAPSNYHVVNANKSYNYDDNTHDVAVLPNSINIHFITKDSASNSDVVLVANNVNIGNCNDIKSSELFKYVDVPVGYNSQTITSDIHYPNTYDVTVTPVSASADIDYQYNGNTIASTEASGSYGTPSSINSNSFSVAGWHLAGDGTQDFEFNNASGASANGSVDVNVLPNSATDTINYQYNGQTLASQPFSGNDYRASQAGDNSVDVTANNDSAIPNGYELVNGDNNFSFDNGTHDVAIQPIPQPVPYIPSMPVSSVASASSANSESTVPASNTISQPSNEIKPIHRSHYSHYRYAKVVTPLQLHTSKHFTDKNGVLVIKHPTEFRIMKIVHDHKYTRYEVKYQGHNYFITANDHFTVNNYVQKHDFKSHKHMIVKVIKPMIEYKHAHFNRKYAIRVFKKGAVLPVKRVFTIGKGEMTRFELTNGRYVTSNKLFVKVIK